jgi:hypothetical protein
VQLCPLLHALPHVPQLATSVCRFLQPPVQLVSPLVHTQLPPVQVSLFETTHAVVHVPQ